MESKLLIILSSIYLLTYFGSFIYMKLYDTSGKSNLTMLLYSILGPILLPLIAFVHYQVRKTERKRKLKRKNKCYGCICQGDCLNGEE
jgi:multisubunit Na+/H+ antiporter MnhG subunit